MKEINVNINSFMDEFRSLYKWLIDNGKIRIYKPYNQKCFCVQKMEKVKFEYSGIPVFMPGGKNTLI